MVLSMGLISFRMQTRYLSRIPLRPKKAKSTTNRKWVFVDWRKVNVVGGPGGNGACSFLALWCNPNAGPDGGDGGHGGHIIFQASTSVNSLGHVSTSYAGLEGEKGYNKDCNGKNAEHTWIKVPLGTVIKTENGKRVADLDIDRSFYIGARGGAGGKGNHFFMSNEVKAPLASEFGGSGEERTYTLELKSIAHVGLIGFPNAGKSTLLRAISRARPKVASYPFTTLNPHIGVVEFDDYEQLFVADIPGLIPGAHKNRGLGISFLRHIERCTCLLYVIDLSAHNPWEQLHTLRYELDQYNPGLSNRPHAIVGNKIDVEGAESNLKELRKRIVLPVMPISAKMGNNVSSLLCHLRELYDNSRSLKKTVNS